MSPLDQDTGRLRGYNNSHIFGGTKRDFEPSPNAIKRGDTRRRIEDLKAKRELEREFNYL